MNKVSSIVVIVVWCFLVFVKSIEHARHTHTNQTRTQQVGWEGSKHTLRHDGRGVAEGSGGGGGGEDQVGGSDSVGEGGASAALITPAGAPPPPPPTLQPPSPSPPPPPLSVAAAAALAPLPAAAVPHAVAAAAALLEGGERRAGTRARAMVARALWWQRSHTWWRPRLDLYAAFAARGGSHG